MGITVLPTSNALDVIAAVRAALPDIEKQLPVGMKLGVPYDSTKYIENAIHEVVHTLARNAADRGRGHLPVFGFVPLGDRARSSRSRSR